jgi:electron transfer flavoprotein alpha subunit
MFSRLLARSTATLGRASSSAPRLLHHQHHRFASTLVLADHNNAKLDPTTRNTITAGVALGSDVTVLVAGDGCADVAAEASQIAGVAGVVLAEHAALAHATAENVAALLVSLQADKSYTHILATANAIGKDVLPRAAAVLDVQPISDVSKVVSESTFERPIYAGNAIATVESSDSVRVVSVRSTCFEPAADAGAAAAVESFACDASVDAQLSTWVADELTVSERPALGAADVIVSGGRGMKSAENFAMLETLADKLGGAVGASRAAVDAGYCANDMQIGQTGKVVAPNLYIAVGISGAIQHLAGMKDSKCIVAVNKDADAPIFQVADYGLVDDLFKAVPALTEQV